MRHLRKINHLGRTSEHRKAMLSNMAASLILHKRITTTVAKAKALRSYVEPLITKSKSDSTHSRRVVFSYLQNKEAVSELFRDVAVKIADRPGGYTRIIKTGTRMGDNAEMCLIELVDYNENMLRASEGKAAEAAKTTRRGRRGTGKKKETEAKVAAPAVKETPEVVEPVEEVVEEPVQAKEAAVEETDQPSDTADEKTAEETK